MTECIYTEGGVVCAESLYRDGNTGKGIHDRHEHKHKEEDCEVNAHLYSYNQKNETFTQVTPRETMYCHKYREDLRA